MIDFLLIYLILGVVYAGLISYLDDFEDLGPITLTYVFFWPAWLGLLLLVWFLDEGD